jgi:hypothetical protein
MMRVKALTIFCILVFIAVYCCGCAVDNDIAGEDYGDIADTASGTTLTQENHPVGWQKSTCFDCHSTENIHQTDRTGTGLNLEAIRELTMQQGLDSCPACHGDNGVE